MPVLLHHLGDHRPAVGEAGVLGMHEHGAFMLVGADDEANPVSAAAADRVDRADGHQVILNRSWKEHARVLVLMMSSNVLISDKEQAGIHDTELRKIFLRPVHALKEEVDVLPGSLVRHHAVGQRALRNRLLEGSLYTGACQHIDDRSAARGFAADRDPVGVSAESCNILMDPVHSQDLIGETAV